MPEKMIVSYCAPTLAGVKTANLFSCEYEDCRMLEEEVHLFNQRLQSKNIRMMILGYPRNRALIYVYRPILLRKDLEDVQTKRILKDRGYQTEDIAQCLQHLIERLDGYQEFPHEIGCFLGYPSEDVSGFIEQKKPCKCVGTWKVYGDVKKANALFETYRKCTCFYERQYDHGISLENLVIR